ncbi:hypothetical protein ACIP98_14735 [Streptomyces sp. NPDC088354]|uniref:hypothetical protein n=1 Tax=Streptomyces sp. NPDC088354 TaxID=3365856 RepID=UPI0037F866B0
MTGKHRKTSLWPHRHPERHEEHTRHAATPTAAASTRAGAAGDAGPACPPPLVPGTHVDGSQAPHHRA